MFQIFRRLYEKVLNLSLHKHAPYYLAGVSFVESSVFPIPPDVMLIPMVLSQPRKAKEYAAITIIASILGGLAGYLIGYFAFELIGEPMIAAFGYEQGYTTVRHWFEQYGFWVVLLAGFTPVPYKIFTLAAGASQMALLPFIMASILGRFIRFAVVVYMVNKFGKKIEEKLIKYIEIIGWTLFILVVGFLLGKAI